MASLRSVGFRKKRQLSILIMHGLQLQLLTLFIMTTILMQAASVKNVFSPEEISDIEKFTGDVIGCSNIAGMSLGIVRGDATFSTGFGVANMENGHKVDEKTLFNLGSASKAFVPYILAEIMNGKENNDGRIKWDSPLKEILRHDHDINVPLTWANTNLKDMLVYKSGSSAADMSTMVGLPADVTKQEVIRRLQFLPTNAEFRNSNHHSNIMYTVAGHLAERLAGMSWTELVKTKVFDKLFMNTSTFAPEGMAKDDVAHPYKYQGSKPGGEQFGEQNITLFNLHPFEPTGSLMSSAEDMTKWLRHLLHNLNAKGNDSGINLLIGDAFHQWVTVPSNHRDGKLGHDHQAALGYGMGWYDSTYRGTRRYKYSGSLYAFRTEIWLFPESYSAIFVAFSGPGQESVQRAVDGILYHISDVIMGKLSWIDTDQACSCQDSDLDYENDQSIKNKITDQMPIKYLVPVEKYIGNFGNGIIGDLIIKLNDTGFLIVKIGRNCEGFLMPGINESVLNFITTGPLLNTEEWITSKTFEFLSVSPETISKSVFHIVRMYLKENLFYDFERDNLFETFIDEYERKQQDGAVASVHESHINHETDERNYANKELNKHKGDKKEHTKINNEGESNNENHGKVNNGLGSGSMSGGQHNHQSLNMEGQGDEPDLNEVKDSREHTKNVPEAHKQHDSTSKNSKAGLNSTKFSFLILLLVMFYIV